MTYETALELLEASREACLRLRINSMRMNTLTEISQHLTATYGTERVKGGKPYENPALRAIIRDEARIEAMRRQIEADSELIARAETLLKNCLKGLYLNLLTDYYCFGQSYKQLASVYCWSSSRTPARKIRKAQAMLRQKLSQE